MVLEKKRKIEKGCRVRKVQQVMGGFRVERCCVDITEKVTIGRLEGSKIGGQVHIRGRVFQGRGLANA